MWGGEESKYPVFTFQFPISNCQLPISNIHKSNFQYPMWTRVSHYFGDPCGGNFLVANGAGVAIESLLFCQIAIRPFDSFDFTHDKFTKGKQFHPKVGVGIVTTYDVSSSGNPYLPMIYLPTARANSSSDSASRDARSMCAAS